MSKVDFRAIAQLSRRSYFSIAIILIFLGLGLSQIRELKLLMPQWFGMESLTTDIFVDRQMTQSQQETFRRTVQNAKLQVSHYWGKLQSSPKILACSTEKCFRSFGGKTAKGLTYGASIILLSPRGLDVFLLTHELSHAELHTQVGGYLKAASIPRWFDEGFAVMISNDANYSEQIWQKINRANIPIPQLSELETRKDWLKNASKYNSVELNPQRYKVVYTFAGQEVRQWYERVGIDGFRELIEAVRSGKAFMEAYN